jgi:hypothetical protein
MKWNLYFTLKGPGGTVEAPNTHNPIESPSMIELMRDLTNLVGPDKFAFGLELVGLRIEQEKT